MRLRNEALSTGSLLAFSSPEEPRRSAGILFLVEGAPDIAPLRDIEQACRPLMDGRFRWHTLANQFEPSTVGLRLDPTRMTRLEVAEFRGLSLDNLGTLLSPALQHLQQGTNCFPSATRTEGSVARGVDFLGRDEELAILQGLLEQRNHVLLVAPRRSGKTSLLYRLSEMGAGKLRLAFIDVEKFRSPEALGAGLLAQATGRRFTEALKEVRARSWQEVLHEAIGALAADPRPLVLILDELVFLLDNIGDVDGIRAVLTALDAAVTSVGARLVVAGSLALEHFVRERGMGPLPGVFGALRRYLLPPLAQGRLEIELRRVLLGTGLVADQADLKWLAENVDLAMPYPALRFLGHLASVAHERVLRPEELEEELDTFLETTDAFADLLEHLRELAQEDLRTAEAIEDALDRLSLSGRSLELADVKARFDGTDEQQRQRFAWLMEHFPVSLEGEQVRLASHLFQRFWRTHQGAGT
jgi:hypothetical protein